jgi:hypothetical protein
LFRKRWHEISKNVYQGTTMSFPLKDCTTLKNCLPELNWEKKDTVPSEQGKGNNAGSFNKLLEDEVSALKHGDRSLLTDLPLDKDELIRFTQIIRSQLNDYLFQMAGEDFTNDYSTDLEGLSELYMSKTQHPFRKEGEAHVTEDYGHIIDHASERYDIDPALIRSVIRAESDFDRYCTSHKGAMGLMQLMPGTAKDMGVYDPYDPFENIMGGTRYLRKLMDRYDGDITLALSAYNWGMTKVESSPDRLPQETLSYILKVNKYYNETG